MNISIYSIGNNDFNFVVYNAIGQAVWKKEVQAIKSWLDDLDLIDYEEPKIVNFNYENSNEHFDFTKENPQICEIEHKNEKKKFSVKYTPNFQKSLDFKNYFSNGLQLNVNSQFEAIEYFENYCKNDLNLTYNSQFMSLGSSNKSSTILIAFNKPPELENILFLLHSNSTNRKEKLNQKPFSFF